MCEGLVIFERVRLDKAPMVVGLSGWGNAGEVSTFTVRYLIDRLSAKKFGEVPPEGFYNYLIQRPLVSIEGGLIESYIPPKNEFFYTMPREGGGGLVLLIGSEPHLNWSVYARAILRMVEEVGVGRIYTIGGYLADIQYGGEPPITATTNNGELLDEFTRAGLGLTDYRGPTSVYSEVLWQGRARGLDVVSLWCGVPTYVGGLYPMAAYHMLKRVAQLIGMGIDLGDLRERARSFEAQMEGEAAGQPQRGWVIEDTEGRRGLEKKLTYIS